MTDAEKIKRLEADVRLLRNEIGRLDSRITSIANQVENAFKAMNDRLDKLEGLALPTNDRKVHDQL
jgi:uncharacterized protein YlxW (UPF0749 family)